MNRILKIIGAGRAIGIGLIAGTVLGAILAIPLLASAGDRDSDPESTVDVSMYQDNNLGIRSSQRLETGGDTSASFWLEYGARRGNSARVGIEILETVADLTGTEPSEVFDALASDQTLVEFAGEHGVTESELLDGLLVVVDERLAEAVQNEKMTQEEADLLRSEISEHLVKLINGETPIGGFGFDGPFPGFRGMTRHPGFWFNGIKTVAELTGTEPSEVADALRDGQSLADYAEDHGVSEDEVVAAIMADVEDRVRARINSQRPMFDLDEESGLDSLIGPFGGVFGFGDCDDNVPADGEDASSQI